MNARHDPTRTSPTADDLAQYERDMLAFEKAASDALRASLTRPLTVKEADAIAFWAQLPSPTYTPPTRRVPPMRLPTADGDPF